MSNKKIILAYLALTAVACTFHAVSLKWRELFFVVPMIFLVPFIAGYFNKPILCITVMNSIYFPVAMFLPRFMEGAIAKKAGIMDHVLIGIYFALIGLVAAVVMSCAGRFIRRKLKDETTENGCSP